MRTTKIPEEGGKVKRLKRCEDINQDQYMISSGMWYHYSQFAKLYRASPNKLS